MSLSVKKKKNVYIRVNNICQMYIIQYIVQHVYMYNVSIWNAYYYIMVRLMRPMYLYSSNVIDRSRVKTLARV